MIGSWSPRSPKALLALSCASGSWRSQTSPNDWSRRSRAEGSSHSISAAPSTIPDTRRSFRPDGARDCPDGGRRCSPSCTTTPSARERSSRSPVLRSWRSASNSRFEPSGRPLHAGRMLRRMQRLPGTIVRCDGSDSRDGAGAAITDRAKANETGDQHRPRRGLRNRRRDAGHEVADRRSADRV